MQFKIKIFQLHFRCCCLPNKQRKKTLWSMLPNKIQTRKEDEIPLRIAIVRIAGRVWRRAAALFCQIIATSKAAVDKLNYHEMLEFNKQFSFFF